MKLAKYIHDLLLENETVIIPGFGAFISTYKPAEISENEIKPPSKKISFTRQIRNNDGMLVTAIARRAKISQPNALKRIERERENMFYLLDKGEKIIVENLGVLFYDDQNEISFTPFQEDNLLLDAFGFQPVSMNDFIEETVEQETVEAVSETESEPEIIEKVSGKIIEPEIEKLNSTIEVEKEESIVEQKIKTIKLPEFKPEPLIVYPEPGKKTSRYWFLLILIPVLIGGYFVLNKFSKSIHKEPYHELHPQTKKQEIIIQTIAPSDSAVNDSVTEKGEIEAVKTESAQNPILTDTKYYLVGGGFKNEENAEKFITRLKEREINGFILGKHGNLYLVAIESFESENEAYNSLNEKVKKYPEWNLWVFKN